MGKLRHKAGEELAQGPAGKQQKRGLTRACLPPGSTHQTARLSKTSLLLRKYFTSAKGYSYPSSGSWCLKSLSWFCSRSSSETTLKARVRTPSSLTVLEDCVMPPSVLFTLAARKLTVTVVSRRQPTVSLPLSSLSSGATISPSALCGCWSLSSVSITPARNFYASNTQLLPGHATIIGKT